MLVQNPPAHLLSAYKNTKKYMNVQILRNIFLQYRDKTYKKQTLPERMNVGTAPILVSNVTGSGMA